MTARRDRYKRGIRRTLMDRDSHLSRRRRRASRYNAEHRALAKIREVNLGLARRRAVSLWPLAASRLERLGIRRSGLPTPPADGAGPDWLARVLVDHVPGGLR